MTNIRHLFIPLTILRPSCGQSYQSSNEFTEAVPDTSIAIETGDTDAVDAITENVRKRLIEEPALASRVLSQGHRTATSYNLRFHGSCAEGAAMISLVRSAANSVTSILPRCSD